MTRRTLHYEDLELGAVWTTRSRTLAEADLAAYSGLAGDFHPLHADAVAAAGGPFQGRVAPAALLIALAFGLGSMDVPLPGSGVLVGTSWRFLKPVKPGGTVSARWRLQRKRDVEDPRYGLAGWQVTLLDEGEDAVAEGDVTLLVGRRDAVQPAPSRSRRRRRRKAEPTLPRPEANLPPSGDAIPEPAPEDVPPAPARARRRRRRRTSNGEQSKPADGEPAPAPEAVVQNATEREPNAVEKVLGRLTRRRHSPRPAAPASPGTR